MLITVRAVAQAVEILPSPVRIDVSEDATLDDVLRQINIPVCSPYAYVFNQRVCHHGDILGEDGELQIVPICLGG